MKVWIFNDGEQSRLGDKKTADKSESNRVSETTKPSKQGSLVLPKNSGSQMDKETDLGGTSVAQSVHVVPDAFLMRIQPDEEKDFRLTVDMKKAIIETWPTIVVDEAMGPTLYVNLFK
mmetsp:Transcript_12416/g.19431  ORF Transcript_12416/g.19431 Transcript_12416/m.19431 type:complete len:118 (-) Transcript_12416:34-387(-)